MIITIIIILIIIIMLLQLIVIIMLLKLIILLNIMIIIIKEETTTRGDWRGLWIAVFGAQIPTTRKSPRSSSRAPCWASQGAPEPTRGGAEALGPEAPVSDWSQMEFLRETFLGLVAILGVNMAAFGTGGKLCVFIWFGPFWGVHYKSWLLFRPVHSGSEVRVPVLFVPFAELS